MPPRSVLPTEMTALERELMRQLQGRAALPLLPHVAEAAVELARNPGATIEQLVRLMNTDLPLAARFLAVANGVAYVRGGVTASTQSVISALGLADARDLVFHAVYAASATGLTKFQSAVSRAFKRSVVAAVACRIAAPVLNMAGEYAYMSGLLHDIGETRVYRILDGLSTSRADAALIKLLVEKYHPAAGAEIAQAWKLPTEIVDACAAHHEDAAPKRPHVRLVMIADRLVSELEAEALGKESLRESAHELGLSRQIFDSLVGKTRDAVGGRPSTHP